MILGVVIPTVPGRETELERAVVSHRPAGFLVGGRVDVRVVTGYETCGEAWAAGAAELELEHGRELRWIMLSADDLEAHAGWWLPAISRLGREELPGALLYRDDPAGPIRDPRTNDGEPGAIVPFPRVPLLPFELWRRLGPMPALHYYSDVWVGERAAELGWRTRLEAGFAFTHLWAQAGRRQDAEADRRLYESLRSSPR